MILAVDIGATKTNLGVFGIDGLPKSQLKLYEDTSTTLYNKNFTGLDSLLKTYFSNVNLKLDKAIFAVAGPVSDGRAKITNLPWMIDEKVLQKALNVSCVRLINDLEAIAYAVPFLDSHEKFTINKGVSLANGTIAVIAPGTGLGESFLTWDGSYYRAFATEGSHADFAPTNSLEIKLLDYLLSNFDHVSYERICSGIGLPNIYAFLRDSGEAKEPSWLAKELTDVEDPASVIVNTALNKENDCEICTITLEIFVSILGAEAGNLALKVMSKGGVYIGGGIPPRILNIINNGRFMRAFRNKGRMSSLVTDIPVHVILNPKLAIWGAARHALTL